MAKYSYTYGGSQAAFVFSGVVILSQGVATIIDDDAHKKLSGNKFAKHLLGTGELSIEKIADDADKTDSSSKSTGGKSKAALAAEKAAKEAQAILEAIKAELTELEVTFSDDESLEQLQAKLAQVKE